MPVFPVGSEQAYLDVNIWYEWDPSPEQVENAFLKLADYLDDASGPMLYTLFLARGSTEERFETDTDPDKEQWRELDPDYLWYKVYDGYSEEILERTGVLKDAAPNGWRVVGNTLYYDTSVLPPYGLTHQFGSGEKNVGVAGEHRARVKAGKAVKAKSKVYRSRFIRGKGHETPTEIGRGHALPQRAFIGLTEEDTVDIEALFNLWMDRGVEEMPWPAPTISHGGGTKTPGADMPGLGEYK